MLKVKWYLKKITNDKFDELNLFTLLISDEFRILGGYRNTFVEAAKFFFKLKLFTGKYTYIKCLKYPVNIIV